MASELSQVFEKFQNRKKYQDLDKRALDISRKAKAGNLGEGEYADWALISNDPLVMINNVKTFITVLVSRLSSSPFRPENNELKSLGEAIRINSLFTKVYEDVLADGYGYVNVAMIDGKPIVSQVDSRFILFTGEKQTLEDSKDMLVFDIKQKSLDDDDVIPPFTIPTEFLIYDDQKERVEVKHFHKDEDGKIWLDIYDRDGEPKEHMEIQGISRIPIVRFVGDSVELEDMRIHYRGLYHLVASVLKAMTLAATKIQINTAAHDDDNYMIPYDAISNHMQLWKNSGIKTFDSKNPNGVDIASPIPIQKDKQFLIEAFRTWENVLNSLLGPVISSKSEAITEQEVIARNETRDAITNSYMVKMADSISAVYTLINELRTTQIDPMTGEIVKYGDNEPVQIVGGYIEEVRRNKQRDELMSIYNLAKESGLNVQGFAYELLNLSDVNDGIKYRLHETFNADPNASPKVVELTQQLQQTQQQLNQIVAQKDQQIAQLQTKATERLERQSEYVAMIERTKKLDLTFKQWQQETKDAQQARLEAMKIYASQGNMKAVLELLGSMEIKDTPLLAQDEVVTITSQSDPLFESSTRQQLQRVGADGVPIQPEIAQQEGIQ